MMVKRFCVFVMLLLFTLPTLAQDAAELPTPDELEEGWNTLIPAGETMCAHSEDYKFFVREAEQEEAASSNLMIYFQGGGACWSILTCGGEGTFDPSVGTLEEELGGYRGIFNFENPDNPVADYTFVFIPYCTGDVHIGNAEANYLTTRIQHKGFVNTSAVLDWVYENYPSPENIIIAGTSAGAYGSIFYAPFIMNQYPDSRITQIADAGVGTTPAGWNALQIWGIYDNFSDEFENMESLTPENFTNANLYRAAAAAYPQHTFSQFTTALDEVQVYFYSITARNDPWQARMYAILDELETLPNFRSFIAGGKEHVILPRPEFYTYAVDGVRFRDWFADLIAGEAVPNLRCADCIEPETVAGNR